MTPAPAKPRRRLALAQPLAPDAVQGLLREAAEHRVAQRYDAAIPLYLEVERRNPDVADAGYFLVLIDLARDRPVDALPRIRQLTRRFPAIPNLWTALAHTYEQLGEWNQAVSAYERLMALDPARAPVQFAVALETVGRIEAAAQIYRDLLSRDDTRSTGLIGLARLRPKEITPEQLAEIGRAAAEGPHSVRIAASFALGEVLEARQQYDAAFAAFAAGARLKRGVLTGDFERSERPLIGPAIQEEHPDEIGRSHIAAIRFLKSVFTADFIRQNEGRGHHIGAPIFIVGMPRSGSTLLEQILSSHRSVQGMGESGPLAEVLHGRYPDDLFAPNPPDHFRTLAEAYFKAQHARGWGSAPRFVDKSLRNYMSIGMIHLMFPRAVILHSVRDPVETCLGCFRQLFATGNEDTYDLAEIGRAYARYRDVMNHWTGVLPGRVIDVSHEALITDPERRIRWLVTEACGLAWDPACLRFHETKRAVRTASVAQVRQPIFTTALQRWRRYEKHLGPLFEALGPYAPAPA